MEEDRPPGTYQAESAELLKQEGQLGLLGPAQPIQPVNQGQPAKAPTSYVQSAKISLSSTISPRLGVITPDTCME